VVARARAGTEDVGRGFHGFERLVEIARLGFEPGAREQEVLARLGFLHRDAAALLEELAGPQCVVLEERDLAEEELGLHHAPGVVRLCVDLVRSQGVELGHFHVVGVVKQGSASRQHEGMVVDYQNLGDPFVVILALPATLCGIVSMLFITGTTLNVPSLMGAIMAVGVASANSILLVTFAREQQIAGRTAFDAAVDAGHTRIRPVLMTAAAMIVGMVPMAIGGAGEEQNAALARAVIGGLLFATPTTLFVVPYLFAMLRKGNDGKSAHGVFNEESP